MTVYRLGPAPNFPDPEAAEPDGLLAVDGDMSPARLLAAYAAGIFPWFNEGDPLLWWSPPRRALWLPGDFRPSANLRRNLRRGGFEIRVDTAFAAVMEGCARAPRAGQPGTWISAEFLRAYTELHRLGYAHSFETWKDGTLVGGLYGVSLGAAFFGESMYSLAADASKAAFEGLCGTVFGWGFHFIDGQLENPHLTRLGARLEDRAVFLARLREALHEGTRRGSWTRSVVAQG